MQRTVNANSKIKSTLDSLNNEFKAFRKALNEDTSKKIVILFHELIELFKNGKYIESNWTQFEGILNFFHAICAEIAANSPTQIHLTHPIYYKTLDLFQILLKQELGKVMDAKISVYLTQTSQILAGANIGKEEYAEAHRLLKLGYRACFFTKTQVIKSTTFTAEKLEEGFLPSYYAYMALIQIQLGNYKKINKYLMQGLNYYYTIEHPNLRYLCASTLINSFNKTGIYLSSKRKHDEAIVAFEVALELCQNQLETPVDSLKVLKLSDITIRPDNAYTNKSNEQYKKFLEVIPRFIEKEEANIREAKAKYIQDKVEKICPRLKFNYDNANKLLVLSPSDNKDNFFKVLQNYKFGSGLIINEDSIQLPIDDTNPKSIYIFCERLQQSLEKPAVIVNSQQNNQVINIDETHTEEPKKEKVPQLAPPPPEPVLPTPTSKTIKWDNPAIPDTDIKKDYPPYFRIYGNSHIRTYGFFNQKSMETVPEEAILLKAESEALKGRVLSKKNRKGKQGFKPRGDGLVLKLLGKFGDHRFPGKEIARGKIYKDGKPTGKEAQLYEFDYVHKGHKRLVVPKG